RLIWWHDPVESTLIFQLTDHEACLAGKLRNDGTQEFSRIGGDCFLSLGLVNCLKHLGDLGISRTQSGHLRVVALNQIEKGWGFRVRGIACLNERVWRMLFWRIDLSKARAQDSRLPKVATRGDFFLLYTVFDGPDFRPVFFRTVADHDDFEEREVGRKIELVMKPCDDPA